MKNLFENKNKSKYAGSNNILNAGLPFGPTEGPLGNYFYSERNPGRNPIDRRHSHYISGGHKESGEIRIR